MNELIEYLGDSLFSKNDQFYCLQHTKYEMNCLSLMKPK